MYEKIAEEFNKETFSKTANLVALSKDVHSIEKIISIKIASDVISYFVCLRGYCKFEEKTSKRKIKFG